VSSSVAAVADRGSPIRGAHPSSRVGFGALPRSTWTRRNELVFLGRFIHRAGKPVTRLRAGITTWEGVTKRASVSRGESRLASVFSPLLSSLITSHSSLLHQCGRGLLRKLSFYAALAPRFRFDSTIHSAASKGLRTPIPGLCFNCFFRNFLPLPLLRYFPDLTRQLLGCKLHSKLASTDHDKKSQRHRHFGERLACCASQSNNQYTNRYL
jgi:hypothetical protein